MTFIISDGCFGKAAKTSEIAFKIIILSIINNQNAYRYL
jgi:hypothetical protein